MEMALNATAFEPLAFDEMLATDGGGSVGQALAITGGAVEFAWGTMITIVGVCTANPAVAGGGALLFVAGVKTISDNL